MFYWFCDTTHGNSAIPEKTCHCIISYCFIWEDMSKIWALCFIMGSKCGLQLVFSSVLFLGVWNPWWSTFLAYYLQVYEVASFFSFEQFLLYSGADDFSATLDPQELLLLYVFILKVHVFIKYVMLIFQNRVFHMPIRKLEHVRLNCNKQKEYGEIDKVCLFWFIDCPK